MGNFSLARYPTFGDDTSVQVGNVPTFSSQLLYLAWWLLCKRSRKRRCPLVDKTEEPFHITEQALY